MQWFAEDLRREAALYDLATPHFGQIDALKSRPDLNSCTVHLLEWLPLRGRWAARVVKDTDLSAWVKTGGLTGPRALGESFLLKPENLVMIEPAVQYLELCRYQISYA